LIISLGINLITEVRRRKTEGIEFPLGSGKGDVEKDCFVPAGWRVLAMTVDNR
jgi:hypothetical protein